MKSLQIHGMEIGLMPRVVGTLSTPRALHSFNALHRPKCDIVEVRLDFFAPESNWEGACHAIESQDVPVLITLRSSAEGGRSHLSPQQRAQLLLRAIPHVSLVDLEQDRDLSPPLLDAIAAAGTSCIVSYHNFHETPPVPDLLARIESASTIASIVKIATLVQSDKDILTLRQLLESPRQVPLCLIPIGTFGAESRMTFPAIGSCLAYGWLDEPVAPGQPQAAALVGHLRSISKAYNLDFVSRKGILSSTPS